MQFTDFYMALVKPKYRRATENSSRGENIGYFLTIKGERRRVCQLFFMIKLIVEDILVITTWVTVKECNIVKKDKRGNHNKHKRVEDNIKDLVR